MAEYVNVALGVIVKVLVAVGVKVDVLVFVGVGEDVSVKVAVYVDVAVLVDVAVKVAVKVLVGRGVSVKVAEYVKVALGVSASFERTGSTDNSSDQLTNGREIQAKLPSSRRIKTQPVAASRPTGATVSPPLKLSSIGN